MDCCVLRHGTELEFSALLIGLGRELMRRVCYGRRDGVGRTGLGPSVVRLVLSAPWPNLLFVTVALSAASERRG